jgi:hypothetical protein
LCWSEVVIGGGGEEAVDHVDDGVDGDLDRRRQGLFGRDGEWSRAAGAVGKSVRVGA